ncbi:carbohydrate-binding domain-containing protein [Leucobacter sp. NPDC058333]|uniref:carbohydrate-binding domain-containing protein n=1 Tax=Leucobacter sp. NPDC058333 TaxID=3346450 RepID=UPI003650FD5C
MKRTLLTASALVLTGGLLAGCSAVAATSSAASESGTNATAVAFTGDLSPSEVIAANANATTVNDDEWSDADAIDVTLSGDSAKSESDAVTVSSGTDSGGTGAGGTGANVLTISEAGVYRLSGTFDGSVVVAAPDDAQVVLMLDGVTIANDAGAAIDVQTADDVALYLIDGSKNSVSDTKTYADDATVNAAIHADSDLTVSGDGALDVTGNGNDGIVSTDDLVILSGLLSVTAVDDALRGKDALLVEGGTLDLTATGGDGLKSDQDTDETQGYVFVSGGTVDITAGDDGVQAQTDAVVTGGTLTIAATDDGLKAESIVSIGDGKVTITDSNEGIEASSIGIGGGTVNVTSSDDGVNGSGLAATTADASADASGGAGGGMSDTGERVEITGGTVTVNAEGDGLDSNGSLTISGGDVTVYGPTQSGNGALDANGDLTVSGGTVVAFSGGGMEQSPGDSSSLGWVTFSGDIIAGQKVEIVDDSGTTVATATSEKTAGAVTVAGADIVSGDTYTLTADGDELGTATAGEASATQGPGGAGGGMGGGQRPGQAPPTQG